MLYQIASVIADFCAGLVVGRISHLVDFAHLGRILPPALISLRDMDQHRRTALFRQAHAGNVPAHRGHSFECRWWFGGTARADEQSGPGGDAVAVISVNQYVSSTAACDIFQCYPDHRLI